MNGYELVVALSVSESKNWKPSGFARRNKRVLCERFQFFEGNYLATCEPPAAGGFDEADFLRNSTWTRATSPM